MQPEDCRCLFQIQQRFKLTSLRVSNDVSLWHKKASLLFKIGPASERDLYHFEQTYSFLIYIHDHTLLHPNHAVNELLVSAMCAMIDSMSNTPMIPPGSTPPVPPYWRNEEDCIVLIEFLPRDDDKDRARGADAIGCMLAYSRMTDTRMLALVGDSKADAYELLSSFSSSENKPEFLRLLQSNEATACEKEQILVPIQAEIDATQPIARVFPEDVMRQVAVVSMLFGEDAETIQ